MYEFGCRIKPRNELKVASYVGDHNVHALRLNYLMMMKNLWLKGRYCSFVRIQNIIIVIAAKGIS